MSYMNQIGTKERQDYVDFCTNLNSVGGKKLTQFFYSFFYALFCLCV